MTGKSLYDNEEPLAFLISDNGRKCHFFSIASQSGSLYHCTANRVIVYFKYSKWKCRACLQDPYSQLLQSQLMLLRDCRHIQTAKEASPKDLNIMTMATKVAYSYAAGHEN